MEQDINIPPVVAPEEKITKKRLLIGGLAILVLALIGVLIYKAGKKEEAPAEETLAEKQARELQTLRGESKPLTEEEMRNQEDELETARAKDGAKPLSQEQINKQLEELNNLRQ